METRRLKLQFMAALQFTSTTDWMFGTTDLTQSTTSPILLISVGGKQQEAVKQSVQ